MLNEEKSSLGGENNLNTQLPAQPAIPPTPEPKKDGISKSKWIILGIVALVLIAGISGAYLLGNNNAGKAITVPSPDEPKYQGPATPTPTPDPTAGWKSYTATSLNLVFKYPTNFTVNETKDLKAVTVANFAYGYGAMGGTMKNGDIVINISLDTNDVGFKVVDSWKAVLDRKDANGSYYNQNTYSTGKTYEDEIDVRNEKVLKINGFDGIYRRVKVRQIAGETVMNEPLVPELYLLDGKGNILVIQGNFIDENPNSFNIFNNFISTFKFTNSTDETASWKTYSSSNFGVSFKYPAKYGVKESSDKITIDDIASISLIIGKDRYFGCSVPVDQCPKITYLEINGKTAFKNTGNQNSVGGIDLLEYELIGVNPNTPTISTDTEYHLFFDYIGNPSDSNTVDIFNNIANTVQYKYGKIPGPKG